MGRWVLYARLREPAEEDLRRIAEAPGVTVVEQTLRRAMLLEGPDEAVEALRAQLSGWTIAPETVHDPPAPAMSRPDRDG